MAARSNLTHTTKVRCKNRVDNFIVIKHQLRLSRTMATELYLLPVFLALTHFDFPFFKCVIHIQKFDDSVSLSFWSKFLLFPTIQHSFDIL